MHSSALHAAVVAAGLVAGLAGLGAARAAELSAAGSTFVTPILTKWADAFKKANGTAITYQSTGSGDGIKQITNKTVDFGVSDAPLSREDLERHGLLQFPLVIGGNAAVINVPGIQPGQLKLTGPVLANIYLGKIRTWSDFSIAQLNPGVNLPDLAIAVVHRSDGSGTTYIWTDYLSKLSPEWKDKVGVGTALRWPIGFGGKGNEGVSALSGRTPGAIGYVEYAYAKHNKLVHAQVLNSDGVYVEPKRESFQAAAANADWAKAPAFNLMLTDQPGKDSWPITGAVFVLMYKVQAKPDAGKAALAFFDWAYKSGATLAEELDYVPMPDSVAQLVRTGWKEIRSADQKPIWTAAAN